MMLLVREAVQNSWDARLPGGAPVEFRADGYILSGEAGKRLMDEVFVQDAPQLMPRDKLRSAAQIPVLALSDFGTVGLGGPTRGDVAAAEGAPTHFVDFLRNLGRPPDRVHSGGTYGFGKAAYYLASAIQTICVYSRYSADGAIHSRFISAGLGTQFESRSPAPRKHTGRHWWGRLRDGVAEPVTGAEADNLNQLLGGAVRGDYQTGTTVFILMPRFEPMKPEQAMERIGHVLLHYFWPKLIDGAGGTASMSFSTSWQGDDIPFPKPEQAPGLALMMRAFRSAVSGNAEPTFGRVEEIRSQRPKQLLGRVGFVKAFASGSTAYRDVAESSDDGEMLPTPQLQGPIHHVALMRAPNFVVRYLETAALSYDSMDYAGVFVADASLDTTFANAEPPTHDDWVYNLLTDGNERSFVKNSITRLKEAAKTFAAPVAQDAPPHVSASMVEFSRLLGGLIPAVEPPGSRSGGKLGSGSGRGRSSGGAQEESGQPGGDLPLQVQIRGEAALMSHQGIPATKVAFEVKGAAGSTAKVSVSARIVTPDGFEGEPPQGASLPQVLAWLSIDGTVLQQGGESCQLEIREEIYSLVVSMPDDAMVSLSLDVDNEP
ncbi:MAG: hypothetical protein V4505_21780 [Pseudomonadota bacterium]